MAYGGLLPVLVLDPHLNDHPRGAVLRLFVLDDPVHGQAIAGSRWAGRSRRAAMLDLLGWNSA